MSPERLDQTTPRGQEAVATAAGGRSIESIAILDVRDASGRVVFQHEQPAEARVAPSGAVSMSSRSTSRMLALRTAPAPSLAELQERLLTVLLLPEVTQVESLDDLRAPIEQAIALGAPAYNRGDIGFGGSYIQDFFSIKANKGRPEGDLGHNFVADFV